MITKEKLARFFHLYREMREAQINYFRTKDSAWLRDAKQLELKVDRLADELESIQDGKQTNLFGV